MKIITEENGSKMVYVQKMDLAILPALIEDGNPTTVYWYGADSLQSLTDRNKFDFVLIKNSHMADFIEKTKYILNFDEFKDYSIDELKEKIRMIEDSIKATTIDTEEEKSNINFLNRKKYMQLMLLNLIDYKENKITMFIPASYRVKSSKQKKLV